ncbi:hypothetical protein TRFO_07529 [Tritrichomonas foetus]|uniref:Uncharacterized protein n=1 Tax=Tritrichomonas foetus TaxID=1144522 RepID=A0A1J4JT59_9EUKA|nr:hypothetical protein TRFO_07529 [Tritrichomonas foetus]|eukprot:OHT01616.1 hypothetical protein TRFO_07529 [Tritrichomonas foetus]
MSKTRKGKSAQIETSVVLDSCGVNVLDPNGVHTVNFNFEISATDISEEPKFEGEIEIIFPHNLPKSQKPPKIEITHPSTTWNSTYPIQIDDNFINTIKEKRLIYKLVFNAKIPGHKTPSRLGAKKGQSENKVQTPTVFFDASTLLVRGGRFKPFLSASAKFENIINFSTFSVSLTVDHPLLSDAQIRKFQPKAFYIKSLHQIPDIPIPFKEIEKHGFIPPYVTFDTGNQIFSTIPMYYRSDIKYNTVLIIWKPINPKEGKEGKETKEMRDSLGKLDMSGLDEKRIIKVELHDREYKIPENFSFIGHGFISPEPKNEIIGEIQPLSIETILDIKKDNVQQPYGKTQIEFHPSRNLSCFKPFIPKDTTVQAPFYVEAGTYLTTEIEFLASHLPPLPQITPSSSSRKHDKHHNKSHDKKKTNEKVEKPLVFHRIVIVSTTKGNNYFLSGLQDQIVQINTKIFNLKDPVVASTQKIDSIKSEAISGTLLLIEPESQIYFLETVDGSEADSILCKYLERSRNRSVYFEPSQLFTERLYYQFDCAVKKFKFPNPISEILTDPEIYLQNSPLSNCFTVLNQINQLLSIKSFSDICQYNLWPKKGDLEMISAKKGCLLSFEELAFPPMTPEVMRRRSSYYLQSEKEEVKELEKPQFKYIPINQDKIDDPVHDLKYYDERNKKYIKELDQKIPKTKGRIQVAEDGESEIWETSSIAVSTISNNDWEVLNPEKFKALAYETSTPGFLSQLREENGTESRNGKTFYGYRSPKSALSKREELMVDVNVEPWLNGDNSLAACEQRWLTATRGPLISTFKTIGKEQEFFNEPNYQSLEDKYRPHTTFEKRNYVAKPKRHKKMFVGVISPIRKNEPIKRGQKEEPPLTVEEPYKDKLVTEKVKEITPRLTKKPRFHTLYQPPLRKGDTDSLAVRKMTTNLPKIA